VSFQDKPIDSDGWPEARIRFFASFDRTGSASASAAELGLNRHTCQGWVRAAGRRSRRGVDSVRPGHPGRAEYDRLRSAGTSRREAAAAAGVHVRTARDWDRGVRKLNGRRLYPDGRLVDYARGTITQQPVPPALEKELHPRFLTLLERERIADLRAGGASVRAVAAALGRPPSTVSRELARNTDPDDADQQAGAYRPYAAHRAAAARRSRPKPAKLVHHRVLADYVQERLDLRWSPEQICHALPVDHPEDREMRVCPETIYQALYLQARGGLRREVAAALRTGRTRRKPRRDPAARTPRFTDPMIMISERPAEIEDRAVPGHWEGDLIIGADGGSAIGTLVERATRYVMLVHLPNGRTAEAVRDQLVATMTTLPEHLRGSLTWDQGAEMAAHRSFSVATAMPVYFCDPASPWQRGSNENTNGLLRQYFPKGTDLSMHGPADLEHVAQQLNGRPRKTLDWETPAQRLRGLLQPSH
jgi:transposase, IS30 family